MQDAIYIEQRQPLSDEGHVIPDKPSTEIAGTDQDGSTGDEPSIGQARTLVFSDRFRNRASPASG